MKGKMENRRKEIMIIAFFIIGICIACILGMFRQGIHFMPGFMYADVEENCYVYDLDQEKFIGQTEVMIQGSGNEITKKFKGEISVAGYEIEGEPADSISTERQDSVWKAGYTGFNGSIEKDGEGEEYRKEGFDRYTYYLQVDIENSGTYAVTIMDREKNKYLYVIHADSEEQAKGVLQSLVLKNSSET